MFQDIDSIVEQFLLQSYRRASRKSRHIMQVLCLHKVCLLPCQAFHRLN